MGFLSKAASSTLKRALITDQLHGTVLWRDNETRRDLSYQVLDTYGLKEGFRFHDVTDLYDLVDKAVAVADPAKRPAALNKIYMRLLEESYELAIGPPGQYV
jgi:hypothetical protein